MQTVKCRNKRLLAARRILAPPRHCARAIDGIAGGRAIQAPQVGHGINRIRRSGRCKYQQKTNGFHGKHLA